jgi:hypothetical protein
LPRQQRGFPTEEITLPLYLAPARPQDLTPARALAEAAFKRPDRTKAMTDSEIQAQALRDRTARLRELRLAKEVAVKGP